MSDLDEYYESEQDLEEKVEKLAELIKKSQYIVVFTGAGISTAAGIPDYRGPRGVWTCINKGEEPPISKLWDEIQPTLTHMAIKKLVDYDIVKYIISQNTDNLHLQSGIPISKISEMHGNGKKEYCSKCKKIFYRSFPVRDPDASKHKTGRFCEDCGGELFDSIVDFGDKLPQLDLNRAFEHSKKADLVIVLGSSLQVSPTSEMPLYTLENDKNPGNLVIVNLQVTPKDQFASLKIFAESDIVMKLLMKKLGIHFELWDELEEQNKQNQTNESNESNETNENQK
ncbi:nad-dependent protein deacetylase sirtuin-7 [Anaeramoeba ignava]|uniref:protein acetyllysine N-acetyltransferase n=1 Tax=Anaeramoeba ignava TaxID=1746090 RepID=A0A9Q0L8E7_ANAIG|nr:nad-dependent protein deacetylase sirtuin-7 [Anaeramoeba ignava]